MVSIEEYVNNFPAKVVSRMTPPHTSISKDILNLKTHESKERLDGESGQYVLYRGYRLRFGSCEDKNHIWVRVEPYTSDLPINKSKLAELLQHPESFSAASKEKKEEHLTIVSKGELNESQKEDTLAVKYKIKKSKKVSQDEIFEAFWYVLKPILNAIPDKTDK